MSSPVPVSARRRRSSHPQNVPTLALLNQAGLSTVLHQVQDNPPITDNFHNQGIVQAAVAPRRHCTAPVALVRCQDPLDL